MPTMTAPSSVMPTLTILRVPIHALNMEQALAQIDAFVQKGTPHHVVTADASMIVTAQDDPDLKAIIERAALVTPDGAGLLWAAKRQGTPLQERVSGVTLVERLCALSSEKGYRIYFFGAGPNVAEQAGEKMCQKYPGAHIVGTRNGFFTQDDVSDIVAEIREARPHILCVALGIPKQEKWIANHLPTLGVPVLIGVGGTFDVLSGNVRRAPLWMQRLSLEWLWRLLLNPSKLSKVKLLPRFVRLILRSGRT